MLISRRGLLGTLAMAALAPASLARAATGEPFPVYSSQQNQIPAQFRRHEVSYATDEPAGTIVVDPAKRHLYFIEGGGRATSYGISVGKTGKSWSGETVIGRMTKWPTWTPTPEHLAAHPDLAKYLGGMPPGPGNPMGARALYLYRGTVDTVYRIHGTHDPRLIGYKTTAGCFGMLNVDVIDLFARVNIGTRVVVLPE
jgi:lipoprotein-anchoring transpeptidase ErfK/SrfK